MRNTCRILVEKLEGKNNLQHLDKDGRTTELTDSVDWIVSEYGPAAVSCEGGSEFQGSIEFQVQR
jgi:hypothetical protein